MAKIKNNLYSFILAVVSVLTGILAFVSLAFKVFAKQVTKVTLGSNALDPESADVSFKNWLDMLKTDGTENGLGWLKTARVFLIITLVLVAIAAILAVVNFFVKNKYLNIALTVVGGLAIVSALVMLITLLVGSGMATKNAEKLANALAPTGTKVSIKLVPGAIPVCLFVFSVITGAIATVSGSLGLAKKSK